MDGVVCDNMGAHVEAWRRFLRGHGIEIETQDFMANTMGMPTQDVLSYYFKRVVRAAEAASLADVKEKLYRSLYAPKRRAAPGLRRFIASARAEGDRLGLGTGSKDDNVTFILDGLKLRKSFDAVVDASQVKKGKPDPETFLTLADKLKARPRDCIVFEDSLLGEEAARRAGMAVVAITTSHRPDEFKHARVAVRDFRKLATATVRALAARR